MLDCELLREVYINLLDAKEPKFNLSNNISEININKAKDYNKTIVKISDEELKKHKDFLKSELKKKFLLNFSSFYIIFQNQQFHLFLHL